VLDSAQGSSFSKSGVSLVTTVAEYSVVIEYRDCNIFSFDWALRCPDDIHVLLLHISTSYATLRLSSLEQPVISTSLCRIPSRTLLLPVLRLTRRLEEQTGALSLLDHVAKVTPVRRVAVVLDVLPARSIRQSVLVFRANGFHDGYHGFFLRFVGGGLQRGEDG
jgi:hypothetical protein